MDDLIKISIKENLKQSRENYDRAIRTYSSLSNKESNYAKIIKNYAEILNKIVFIWEDAEKSHRNNQV